MADAPIPLARPVLGEEEEQAVIEVLRSGQLSLGPRLPEFERALRRASWARRTRAPSAAARPGLHLALRAVGVGEGDEVVTSPFSFVASANAALYERARPVFADIDPVTLNLDPEAAAAAVTERTRALLPVHIFGYPADMAAFERLAAARGAGDRGGRVRGAGRGARATARASADAGIRRCSASTPTSS